MRHAELANERGPGRKIIDSESTMGEPHHPRTINSVSIKLLCHDS